MTKQNPFDAAIEALGRLAETLSNLHILSVTHIEELTSYRAAIRLLEAAGEVSIGDINRPIHGYVDPPVANLLEEIDSALPDKEPE
jgi:hypothetical protein